MTRKKRKRQLRFQPGDVVTWGRGILAHRVLGVYERGLIVDSTSSKRGRPMKDGRLTRFIEFAPGRRPRRYPGPPWLATFPPDEDPATLPEATKKAREEMALEVVGALRLLSVVHGRGA